MFRSFAEIESYILEHHISKHIALAGAHDSDALAAVVNAKRRGCITATLIGNETEIKSLLEQLNEPSADYRIIPCAGESACANLAFQMVKEGLAEIPMKGLMQTAAFMRAVLDKQYGLIPDNGLLSQATVLEYRQQNRLMVISDCAVNISPEYEDKLKIINNAVRLAQQLGCVQPRVAVLSALESINSHIKSTVEAAMLSKAAERGQIKDCLVDGPLALDNAVSREAAAHKGIKSPVAGVAEILIMPDLLSGNIFTKSLTYFAELPSSGTLTGTSTPVIMTSRADQPQNKYYSILTAILQSLC